MRPRVGTHLLRRGLGFYLRVRLPADIAVRVRRREVVKTLRTQDVGVARHRAATIALGFTVLWARARMADTADQIEALLDRWFADAEERAYRPLGEKTFARALVPEGASDDQLHTANQDYFAEDAERRLQYLRDAYKAGNFDPGMAIAKDIAAKLTEATTPRTLHMIAKRAMEGIAKIEEARLRWAAGDVEFSPSREPAESAAVEAPQAIPAPAPASTNNEDDPTLTESIAAYIAQMRQDRRATEKQIRQTESELGLMCDALGKETKTKAVTRALAGEIFKGLRSLPSRFRKHRDLKGLPFAEMAKKARQLGLHPMHARTVNGYRDTMSAFFREQKMVGHATENPFEGMHAKVVVKGESDRAFTDEELAEILSNPLFMGSKSIARPYDAGSVVIGDWKVWTVLVALTSGARISEIMQLRCQDVREIDGIWIFDFNDDDAKRIKTSSSVRRVPVHNELIRIGLIELRNQRGSGERLLLPDAPAPVQGDYGKQASKWFSETFLPRCLSGGKRPGTGMHSFRHNLKTALRDAEVDATVSNRLTGHENANVGASYGRYKPKMLAEALNKARMPAALSSIPSR
jgi:integrase